jgi:kumamolisin
MLALSLEATAANVDFRELADHIPAKVVSKSARLSPLAADKEIHMNFVLPLRNQPELQDLITRLYEPSDPEYGRYLSADEFIERFSPLQEDYDQVVEHAKSLGLTIQATHPNRTLLHVSGPLQMIESAFNIELHHYMAPEGRHFYAPSKNPEVHVSIASVISGLVGLDNCAEWHSYKRQKEMSEAKAVFPSGPGGGFAPRDIVTAYNLSNVSTKGANQVIALFELAGYQASDITAYTTHFGLPAPKLKNILVDGGSQSGIDSEVTLDIELALALAPESEIYVYEGPNSNQGVLDTYNRIATDNLAKQVSTSWGSGEDTVTPQYLQAANAIFQQMAAQGQTIYAAAGDSGAYDDYADNHSKALVVDDPASQPYVVGVGGTRLTVNATTGDYKTESVWNDGLGSAGGGGVSTVWPIPSWQAHVTTASSKTHRNVPDVSLDADPNTGYAIYYDGSWQIFGGTSCAAPLWAAFTACVNEELAATSQPALGFANPKFYAIGLGSAYSSDFHDVMSGNNLHYKASKGYDNASGWGSLNGANLYANLIKYTAAPLCRVVMKHEAPFTKGQSGTYVIEVSNKGNASTLDPVTVAVSLPEGLTYSSFSGSGWVHNGGTLSFTQSDSLKAGSSYPALVLEVHVATEAPSSLTIAATVSGGGSVSETITSLTTTH